MSIEIVVDYDRRRKARKTGRFGGAHGLEIELTPALIERCFGGKSALKKLAWVITGKSDEVHTVTFESVKFSIETLPKEE